MPIDSDQFRQVLSRWASGITVVTTRCSGGIHGMTASSFAAVSLEPPLVLVSIDVRARTHALIAEQRAFGVHILTAGQEELSELCAGRLGEEGHCLAQVDHRREVTGAPILAACSTWLDCSLWATHPAGDHTLYLGRVEAASAADLLPLLWFNRGYHRLGP